MVVERHIRLVAAAFPKVEDAQAAVQELRQRGF